MRNTIIDIFPLAFRVGGVWFNDRIAYAIYVYGSCETVCVVWIRFESNYTVRRCYCLFEKHPACSSFTRFRFSTFFFYYDNKKNLLFAHRNIWIGRVTFYIAKYFIFFIFNIFSTFCTFFLKKIKQFLQQLLSLFYP